MPSSHGDALGWPAQVRLVTESRPWQVKNAGKAGPTESPRSCAPHEDGVLQTFPRTVALRARRQIGVQQPDRKSVFSQAGGVRKTRVASPVRSASAGRHTVGRLICRHWVGPGAVVMPGFSIVLDVLPGAWGLHILGLKIFNTSVD
jgi:hypothetical protein